MREWRIVSRSIMVQPLGARKSVSRGTGQVPSRREAGRIVPDGRESNLSTWLFIGGLSFLLAALAALYVSIELHRRNAVKGHLLSV